MLDEFLQRLVKWGVSLSDAERYSELTNELDKCCSDIDVEMFFEELEIIITVDYPTLPDDFREDLRNLSKGYGVDFI